MHAISTRDDPSQPVAVPPQALSRLSILIVSQLSQHFFHRRCGASLLVRGVLLEATAFVLCTCKFLSEARGDCFVFFFFAPDAGELCGGFLELFLQFMDLVPEGFVGGFKAVFFLCFVVVVNGGCAAASAAVGVARSSSSTTTTTATQMRPPRLTPRALQTPTPSTTTTTTTRGRREVGGNRADLPSSFPS